MRRDVFQAIADPNRRAILGLLVHQSLTLNGVADNFRITRQAVSKHMKILAESGLVIMHRKGREQYCEARLDKLTEVSDWIEQNRRIWDRRLDQFEDYLQEFQRKEKKRAKKRSHSEGQ
jgi:DNA-binding transcriptional ArsR family regulator